MSPHPVRRLGTLVEPLAAAVYFAPEAHAAYAELGDVGDFWAPYYASRGACLGETPGLVVAAAFRVFNPAHIAEQLEVAWKVATPSQWWTARVRGATAQLERLLGESPEGGARATELLRRVADNCPVSGHPFYAGLVSQPWPGTLLGDLWHAADLVREHRGDTHTAAYNAAGFTAPEIMMMTELWWGLPHGLYLASRHWDPSESQSASRVCGRRAGSTATRRRSPTSVSRRGSGWKTPLTPAKPRCSTSSPTQNVTNCSPSSNRWPRRSLPAAAIPRIRTSAPSRASTTSR